MRTHMIPTTAELSTKSQPKSKPASKYAAEWEKIKSERGLYRYRKSGVFFANVWRGRKQYRESLKTTDLAFARRKLHDLKARIDRTDPRFNKTSLADWLKVYFNTLRGAPSTLVDKRRIVQRVKSTWFLASSIPMRDLRRSQIETWLNQQYGGLSSSSFNSALTMIRDAFRMAVRDRVIAENPISDLAYRKRQRPIRLTPTWEQFCAIIADVRAQPFNRDAEDSGDFLEACGLLGLGQAEVSGIQREHIDLESGRIAIFRHKTSVAFHIPIFPQARALIERLCAGKKHHQHLFAIQQARKALRESCKRLGFPAYTHRSLRRMFITRCLELGIDVKLIANWQGHKDQGVLILQTYSHVRPEHERHMAARLTSEQPENVIPLDDRSQQG